MNSEQGAHAKVERFDQIDIEILRILQTDCSKTIDDIVTDVEEGLKRKNIIKTVPRTTVHARIERMEKLGVITSRKAILDPQRLGIGITAFVFLDFNRVAGEDRDKTLGNVVDRLKGLPDVQEIHILAGERDILVKVKTDSVESLANIVLKKIREWDGISGSTTSIVFETHRERTELNLEKVRITP